MSIPFNIVTRLQYRVPDTGSSPSHRWRTTDAYSGSYNAWFQVSAALLIRYSLFWHITRCRLVVIYRRFGTFYKSHRQGSSLDCLTLEDEPTDVPEMSTSNCQSTPRNVPEERIFHGYSSYTNSRSDRKRLEDEYSALMLESLEMSPLIMRPDGLKSGPRRVRKQKNLLSVMVIEQRVVHLVPPYRLRSPSLWR